MYGCESWTIKKAECRRIDAFELWCWRRPLRVPWTARRSNQSILKEISPEYSLQGLMLKLKLPVLWAPHVKNWFMWKAPDAGKDWRQEEKGMTEDEMVGWHHRLNGHEFESTLGVGDGQGGLVCCSPRGCKELDASERLNWTDWSHKVCSHLVRQPEEINAKRKQNWTALQFGFTSTEERTTFFLIILNTCLESYRLFW